MVRLLGYSLMVALAYTVLGMIHHLLCQLVDKWFQFSEHKVFSDNFLSPDWVKMIFLVILWLSGIILINGVFGLAHIYFQTSQFSLVRAFRKGTSFLLPRSEWLSLAFWSVSLHGTLSGRRTFSWGGGQLPSPGVLLLRSWFLITTRFPSSCQTLREPRQWISCVLIGLALSADSVEANRLPSSIRYCPMLTSLVFPPWRSQELLTACHFSCLNFDDAPITYLITAPPRTSFLVPPLYDHLVRSTLCCPTALLPAPLPGTCSLVHLDLNSVLFSSTMKPNTPGSSSSSDDGVPDVPMESSTAPPVQAITEDMSAFITAFATLDFAR